MLLNKISNILGDVIFKKVTFLNGKEVPIFIFQGYVPKRAGCKSGIEDQVCKVLNKANVTAVHSEHSIWLEMCQILYAQAFLYKHQGKWSSSFSDQYCPIIKSPQKIPRCNEKIQKLNINDYFEYQWKFLEKFVLAYLSEPWHRYAAIEFLLTTLKRVFLKKTGGRSIGLEQAEIDSEGIYSSCEGFEFKIGLKSVRITTLLPNNEGVLYNYYITSKKKYLIESPFSIRFGIGTVIYKNNLVSWQPSKDLKYYLDLFKCIDQDVILKLMADLLTDYSHAPEWYHDDHNRGTLSYRGMPDLIVNDLESNSYILLECKAPNDRLRKHQKRWWKRNAEYYNMKTGIVITSKEQLGKLA